MHIHTLPGQNFACQGCSDCCRCKWQIHVDQPAAEGIRSSFLELRVVQETGRASMVEDGPDLTLARNGDGSCVFLRSDELCGVHAELGAESKPRACKEFPYLIRETPDGYVAGLSFWCPSVQQNSGGSLADHQAEMAELVGLGVRPRVGFEPIEVAPGMRWEWPVYRAFEQDLLRSLETGAPASVLSEVILEVVAGWADCEPLRPGDPILEALGELFLAAIIATLECPQAGVGQLTELILAGGYLRLGEFEGNLAPLSSLIGLPIPAWFEAQTRRYLKALIFSKCLALRRPLLLNLLMLGMVPPLLAFYAELHRLQRGGACLGEQDLYSAFRSVELFVTHSEGLDPLLQAFVDGMSDQMQPRRQAA